MPNTHWSIWNPDRQRLEGKPYIMTLCRQYDVDITNGENPIPGIQSQVWVRSGELKVCSLTLNCTDCSNTARVTVTCASSLHMLHQDCDMLQSQGLEVKRWYKPNVTVTLLKHLQDLLCDSPSASDHVPIGEPAATAKPPAITELWHGEWVLTMPGHSTT